MRTATSREATDSQPTTTVQTTLLEVMDSMVEMGYSDEEILMLVCDLIERHELHLIGQFRDIDLVRAA